MNDTRPPWRPIRSLFRIDDFGRCIAESTRVNRLPVVAVAPAHKTPGRPGCTMRSIAIWVRVAPLRGIGAHRIDAASFVGSTRTRHTLLVRRELAVAGISGLASL